MALMLLAAASAIDPQDDPRAVRRLPWPLLEAGAACATENCAQRTAGHDLADDGMNMNRAEPPWSDPRWGVRSDNQWQQGLRLQQGWWRQTDTQVPAGLMRGRKLPVVSMLARGVGLNPNLMTAEAREAAAQSLLRLTVEQHPGMIDQDRLQRNLLSSQPLCFNLFGYLGAHGDALLKWVRGFSADATSVESVRLEWAPKNGVGGSAFDAAIIYALPSGGRGVLGVECKYAEDLKASQRQKAADKYRSKTVGSARWSEGAAEALDRPGLRQLWYNQLLTQAVADSGDFVEGLGVVVACRADEAARFAVDEVRSQLAEPDDLRFSAIEDVIDSVPGHEPWKAMTRRRYTDFTPIQDRLRPDDPRCVDPGGTARLA